MSQSIPKRPQPTPAATPGLVAAAAAGVTLLVVAVLWLGARAGVSGAHLLRDPAASFGYPAYGGALSHLGVALLGATAVAAAFAATLCPGRRAALVMAAVLSSAIAADDLFMVHERIGPTELGIPEEAFLLIYGAMGLVLLVLLFRAPESQYNGTIFIPIALMVTSALVDLVSQALGMSIPVIEDLFKIAGYGAWFAFWWLRSVQIVRSGDDTVSINPR
ncbi:hypothetical protein [Palleronia rufa]|uniref:hypothetical protein n=1 Tax=Palleronia rufa TaxID=1530186 RepID=UPI0005612260|nr:hypothetical protein [Palleronia rufa]